VTREFFGSVNSTMINFPKTSVELASGADSRLFLRTRAQYTRAFGSI
jgi:hypothetical protein